MPNVINITTNVFTERRANLYVVYNALLGQYSYYLDSRHTRAYIPKFRNTLDLGAGYDTHYYKSLLWVDGNS